MVGGECQGLILGCKVRPVLSAKWLSAGKIKVGHVQMNPALSALSRSINQAHLLRRDLEMVTGDMSQANDSCNVQGQIDCDLEVLHSWD